MEMRFASDTRQIAHRVYPRPCVDSPISLSDLRRRGLKSPHWTEIRTRHVLGRYEANLSRGGKLLPVIKKSCARRFYPRTYEFPIDRSPDTKVSWRREDNRELLSRVAPVDKR